MYFSCEKALLLQAVNIASRTVALKSSISALEGILVEAGDNLSLTGYNLETGIRTVIPAEVKEGGRIVLSARLFGEIIRRLPDDMIVFRSENNTVKITCGVSEFNILGTDAEEFPELPSVENNNRVVMQQSVLGDMIGQTLFCIATSQVRPVHTGSLFEVSMDGNLTIVSLDGFRMALRKEQVLEKECATDFSFVVPGASLSEVEKICGDSDKPVEIIPGERHIMFRFEDTTLISRRLEGEFLNYRQSIPKNSPITITVSRKNLLESVERVSLLISEKQKSPLRCTFGNQILSISTKTAIGDAHDECAITGDGEELEIGFNNRYLLEALRAAPADELKLEMNTPISPCNIVSADGSDHFLYMVLPVRLRAN